jgi:hypothetical protein
LSNILKNKNWKTKWDKDLFIIFDQIRPWNSSGAIWDNSNIDWFLFIWPCFLLFYFAYQKLYTLKALISRLNHLIYTKTIYFCNYTNKISSKRKSRFIRLILLRVIFF